MILNVVKQYFFPIANITVFFKKVSDCSKCRSPLGPILRKTKVIHLVLQRLSVVITPPLWLCLQEPTPPSGCPGDPQLCL